MPTPSTDLAAWSALIVTVLTAGARIIGTVTKGRAGTEETLWKRRDQMLDDYRADNERLRNLLRDKDADIDRVQDECDRMRRQRDDCWQERDRRWRPQTPPEATPAVILPKRPSKGGDGR